jgi:hypothetical protein
MLQKMAVSHVSLVTLVVAVFVVAVVHADDHVILPDHVGWNNVSSHFLQK